MRVADIMVRRPVTVAPGSDVDLHDLMATARVRHLPLLDGDTLVGLWIATEGGPIVLLGPESVTEIESSADALDAMRSLLADSEAVLVREGGRPVGMLTRSDALELIGAALDAGIGKRHPRPITIRLVGPAGVGKTTLLLRTLPLLRHCEAGVVRADRAAGEPSEPSEVAGARVIHAPDAHWRRGLRETLTRFGEEVQVVLMEDRDSPPELVRGMGGDLHVLVITPELVEEIGEESLREAGAVVLTQLDRAPEGFDLALARDRLQRVNADLAVIGVAAAEDDRGLDQWRHWIEERVLPARG